MTTRLYVVHNSHPCAAVEKALALKGIAYKVFEYPPPMHALLQPLLFDSRTVPALRYGGEKLQGSGTIMRRLDELVPEPALYPADPQLRAKVEEAERWGNDEFQQVARDLLWAGMTARAMAGYSAGSRLRLPAAAVRALAPTVIPVQRAINKTSKERGRARIAQLPAQVATIDAYIADGTIGDLGHPNAADLQILSTVRLVATVADARPAFAGSRSVELATALFGPLNAELPAGAIAA